MRLAPYLRTLPLLLLAVIGCSKESGSNQTLSPDQLEAVLEPFNQGVAHMERFQPARAIESFDAVVRLAPDWITGRLNLGIALLNSQTDEGRARCEQVMLDLLEDDPDNAHAQFSLGMLFRDGDRTDEARQRFSKVLDRYPDDPDTHYQLALLLDESDPQAARGHLEATLEKFPHHASAAYRMQNVLRQSGENEEAARLMQRFAALKDAKAGILAGMKYGEMGRFANIVRAVDQSYDWPGSDVTPGFEEVASSRGLRPGRAGQDGWPGALADDDPRIGPDRFGPGLAVADVNGDRQLDLFHTGSENGGELLLGSATGFSTAADTGIDGAGAVAAFFADFDRDGDPDLFLTRAGPDRLYRNDGGRFTDVTASTGTAGGEFLSTGASWSDADHDGDLDLYVARYCAWPLPADGSIGAPNVLFRNNGDGSFAPVEDDVLAGNGASIGALWFDVDGDLDLDLYVLEQSERNRLILNDRVGYYRTAPAGFDLLADAGPATGALLGDVDGNGLEDLLLVRGAQPARLLMQLEAGRFVEDAESNRLFEQLGGAVGASLADLDLDGDLDLALFDAGRDDAGYAVVLLMNRGAGRFAEPARLGDSRPRPDARGAMAVDLDADGPLELVVLRSASPHQLWRSTDLPPRHWLAVMPAGPPEQKKDSLAPNALGAQVEVKTGPHLQVGRLVSSGGYLSSPPPTAHFGLGTAEKVDYVRIVWPDSALQSELEVAADQVWRMAKVERKPSSCPVLFSWDGERFEFVTDFLGVGGVGFFVAPGEYAPPDPTEDVRIPPELVALDDGRYRLRVVEPLEEVAYIDQLELYVYDHPSDLELYPDERFTASPPFPSGRPIALREKIFPVAARTDRRDSVLEELAEIDRQYVEPPRLPRFVGFAEDHWLELDFGDQLADRTDADGPLILCLYGWVEYTYSHVNYAAWQAGLTMRSPSIELPDGDGGWQTALPDIGFPAGLPRMMTLDVTGLALQEHGRLRIRTNMELFWDQIYLAEDRGTADVTRHVVRPALADLRPVGFPREYSPDGQDPTLYDYHRQDHGVPFKNLTGDYTPFGDVKTLLKSVDDRFVIMGRGEEIALEFDASQLPPLADGMSRLLVLHCDGYCKDMDLYTAFPDTVEPLPHHGMENYPPRTAPTRDRTDPSGEASARRRIVGGSSTR